MHTQTNMKRLKFMYRLHAGAVQILYAHYVCMCLYECCGCVNALAMICKRMLADDEGPFACETMLLLLLL